MKKALLLFLITIIAYQYAHSQGRWEPSIGYTSYEGFTLKLKYGNNLQVAISQGFLNNTAMITGVEGYWHFAGHQKIGNQKPFYTMIGFGATIFSKGYTAFEKTVFYPRIGRTFNFTNNFGMNIDIGLDFLYGLSGDLYYLNVFPTASVQFFLRL
jgi:hypothetical protein